MAKRQTKAPAERKYGKLIRVSNEFAELIEELAALEHTSVARYLDDHLIAVAHEKYRRLIARKHEQLKEIR